MAKKKVQKRVKKRIAATARASKAKVNKVIKQVKEPLSLLSTLKEEGMANAMMLFTIASGVATGAAKNLRMETVRPQLQELIQSLGFSFRSDIERLESRIEELEQKISEIEYSKIQPADEDE